MPAMVFAHRNPHPTEIIAGMARSYKVAYR